MLETSVDLAEYKQRYGDKDDAAPGWDAISDRLSQVYGNQTPRHWGTLIKHMLDGPDPLDGMSAYECRDGGTEHSHFISYGFSSLYYDEASVGGPFSQFGFELTFRLATDADPIEEVPWPCILFQNLARYVFKNERWFEPYHWLDARGPIKPQSQTGLVGFLFVMDPILQSIDSPHGRVDFIQVFGITARELGALKDGTKTGEHIADLHRSGNPLLVTSLGRKD